MNNNVKNNNLKPLHSINKNKWMIPVGLFLAAFLMVPLMQHDFLRLMPGNLGDARLNNYFLENFYKFFSGGSDSLWHLGFFYPYPYILGFSDNLFGASPVYFIARVLSGSPEAAFQIWFLFGYVLNFFSAYYSLRSLKVSHLAATVGALIFAFALPTTAHSGHAQLHYRFGVPLAIAMYAHFLNGKEARLLIFAISWLVWQFYCGIYMGFFTLLMLFGMSVVFLAYGLYVNAAFKRSEFSEFSVKWHLLPGKSKLNIVLYLVMLFALLALLFYPYLQVSNLYDGKRSWDQISLMLPRPQSYLLSDVSHWWSSKSEIFSNIPVRWEHQMFFGAIPLFLALFGVISGIKEKKGIFFILLSGSLVFVVLLTIYVNGHSLWYLFHKLPLASAIRAMTRLDQVFLFPIGYLAAVGVDFLREKKEWFSKADLLLVLFLLIFEFSASNGSVSAKTEWRERIARSEQALPKDLSKDSILFFAQAKGPFYDDELDAMWIALNHGVKTLNGYSSMLPLYFSGEYGVECNEMPKRVIAYLSFIGKSNDNEAYHALMKRIVPIGFVNCDEAWVKNMPSISNVDHAYSLEQIGKLSYQYQGRTQQASRTVVSIKIFNDGSTPISALSSVGNQMRLSWRFLDRNGVATSGWDGRKDLPFDIPAKGSISVNLYIDPAKEVKGGTLEVSLVQEMLFFAFEAGVKPLSISWD